MTVSTTSARVAYAGDASTTAFAVPYYFFLDEDLAVYLTVSGTTTRQTLTTHYTVSGAGNEAGGAVTMVTAPASTATLTIIREPQQVQETDYQANDPFPAETHEAALDRGVMISQHLQDQINRSLKFNEAVGDVGDFSGGPLKLFGTDATGILTEYDLTDNPGDYTVVYPVVEASFDTLALLVDAQTVAVGDYVRTLGYHAPGDGGGNLYRIVSAGTGTADGGSFIDLTGIVGQAQGLFPDGVFRPLQFGARGNYVDDDADALNATIAYAQTFSTLVVPPLGPVVVDLCSRTYAVSKPVSTTSNAQGVTIQNGGLFAIPGAWSASNALLHLLGYAKQPRLFNIHLNGNKIANGVHTGNAQDPTLDQLWVYNYELFGVKCEPGMFQLRGRNLQIEQMRGSDPDYADQSKRTGYGLWSVSKGDMEIVDSIISCNKYNVYLQGALHFRFVNCHLFNGSNNSSIQHINPVNVRFETGSNSGNVYFDGGYMDNGCVETEVTDGLVFDTIDFYNDNNMAAISSFVKLIATSTDQHLNGLRVTPSCTFRRMNGAPPILEFDESAGTWLSYPAAQDLIEADSVSVDGTVSGHRVISSAPATETVRWYSTQSDAAKLRLSGRLNTAEVSIRAPDNRMELVANGSVYLDIRDGGAIRPGTDNAQQLGQPSVRWSEVFAATGAINTSDGRSKQQISAIPDEWLDAWADVHWCRFKFNDSVDAKGGGARWHTGLVAQQVRDAFAAHGLDAFEIGLLCFDEWDAEPAETDPDTGEVLRDAVPVGNRYGIRYDEAQAMEAAFVRRAITA